jgi:hypothetical protein
MWYLLTMNGGFMNNECLKIIVNIINDNELSDEIKISSIEYTLWLFNL